MAQQKEKLLTENDLNAASMLLVQQLPEHISQLFLTIKNEYNVELWHLLCGILLEVYSEGRVSAFQIDPQWLDGLKQTTLVCKECKKIFTPININQPYCSNECGVKAAKILTTEVKDDKPIAEPEPVVVEPAGVVRAGSIDSGWSDILEEIK